MRHTFHPSKSSGRPDLVRSRRSFLPLVMAATVLAPHAAGAQERENRVFMLDPIAVTATGVAPGGVVIESEELDHLNPTNIKEVFDGEASVNVGGGSNVSRKVYVNGIEDTNLNVKIDGARQVNSAFHHLGTAIIDPGLLKSAHIETGVGPADVGPGSLGGSIAYETKDARDLVAADETFGGFVKTSYDTNARNKRLLGTTAARHDNFEALAYGSWENGENYEDGDGNEVIGTAPKLQNFIGKGAWNGLEGERVEVNGSYTYDSGIRPNRANFGSLVNGSPPSEQAYKRQTLSVSYQDELPTTDVNPEFVLSYNESELFIDNLQFGPRRVHPYSQTVSYNGKAANTFENDLGLAESGTVTLGADFYHDTGKGDVSFGFGGAGVPLQNEETSLDTGLFLQTRLQFTEAFRVSTGARYDQQWFEGVDGTEITSGGPSANINAEYEVVSGIVPYAGAGTTYGPIPLGESAIYNFAGQWDYQGLSSSRSYNYKVGTKAEGPDFTADAHLFLNRINGSHDRGSQLRNTTRDIDSRGLNLSGTYYYGSGFLRATYTHNKVRSDGEVLSSGAASFHGLQMGDILTFSAAHDFGDTGFRVGTLAEFALEDDDNGTSPRPSYFVADIYGQWTPPELSYLDLRLDVRNLFDKHYVSRATSADTDNAQANAFRDPGRTFLLTANMKF